MNTAPNVKIIPAKTQTAENRNRYRQLRVAAYCRVSTEQEEQQNSYQVQIAYYTDLINRKKNGLWPEFLPTKGSAVLRQRKERSSTA